MNLKTLIFFSLGTLLSGCAAPTFSDEIFLADGVSVAPFPPEDFFGAVPAEGIVVPHHIAATYGNDSWEADGVLKVTPRRLTLVASTPVGRLFTLTWNRDDGSATLEPGAAASGLSSLNPRYLLHDLIFVYGDVPALRKNFPEPWEISSDENSRTLSRAGKKIAAAVYSRPDAPAAGNVSFENFARGYRYEITRFQ